MRAASPPPPGPYFGPEREMGEKVSEAPEPVLRGCSGHGPGAPAPAVAAASSAGASSAESSSGSETLSEEGEPGGFSREQPPPPPLPPGGAVRARPPAAWAPARVVLELGVCAPPPQLSGGTALPRGSSASQEEQDEELDHILSPPPMPFRKCSNPDVTSGPAKSLKFKRQLSEDGRELRRGSLGGALTGRYLLPNPVAGQAWPASAETSNLVRMRSQALGQSAPSLTASLKELSLPRRGSFSGFTASPRHDDFHGGPDFGETPLLRTLSLTRPSHFLSVSKSQ